MSNVNGEVRRSLAKFVLSRTDDPTLAEALDNPFSLLLVEDLYSSEMIIETILLPDFKAVLKGVRSDFLTIERDDRKPFLLDLFGKDKSDLSSLPYCQLTLDTKVLFHETNKVIHKSLLEQLKTNGSYVPYKVEWNEALSNMISERFTPNLFFKTKDKRTEDGVRVSTIKAELSSRLSPLLTVYSRIMRSFHDASQLTGDNGECQQLIGLYDQFHAGLKKAQGTDSMKFPAPAQYDDK
jgi:hypothetical protein